MGRQEPEAVENEGCIIGIVIRYRGPDLISILWPLVRYPSLA